MLFLVLFHILYFLPQALAALNVDNKIKFTGLKWRRACTWTSTTKVCKRGKNLQLLVNHNATGFNVELLYYWFINSHEGKDTFFIEAPQSQFWNYTNKNIPKYVIGYCVTGMT